MKRNTLSFFVVVALFLTASSLLPSWLHAEETTNYTDDPGWVRLNDSAPFGSGDIANLPLLAQGLSLHALGTTQDLSQTMRQPVYEPLITGLTTNIPPVSNALIAETVRALDCDWKQCYLFVRNQIHFIPYRAVMRGPERTFLDREGNDIDQSLLLLAMLRACGYTNAGDVTLMYLPAPDTTTGTNGFRVPLGGTASGYDAAAWLGVPVENNVSNTFASINRVLSLRGFVTYQANGATVDQSALIIEHYWVRLNISGVSYDLDPSFKPCLFKPPSGNIRTAMQYSRDALTNAAGGVNGDTGDKYSVTSISTANLAAKLCQLSSNLAACWAGTNAMASDYVGSREIGQQNVATDPDTFHGLMYGTPLDYFGSSMTDWFRDHGMRTLFQFTHGSYSLSLWADEIAARHLWVSYTNTTGYTNPRAVVWVDDMMIGMEPATYADKVAVDSAAIVVWKIATPGYCNINSHSYGSFERGLNNVFTIPVTIGNVRHGGMRDRALRELERLRAAGLPDTNLAVRARVLQVAGQQWTEQTAKTCEFNSQITGLGQYTFYRIGISGQKTSPFYDVANCLYAQTNSYNGLDSGVIFGSALEHAVWDQLNGTNLPAVSTVRIMDLANAAGQSIYLVNKNNWTTGTNIKGKLANYPTTLLNTLTTDVGAGSWLLIPHDGQTSLNTWKGYGYVEASSNGYLMAISGGLNGGFGTWYGYTPPINPPVVFNDTPQFTPPVNIVSTFSTEPVDLCSGAETLDRTDLSLAGPVPLAMSRHYDSRQRHNDGPFGCGWTHSWDQRVVKHADADAFLGSTTPAVCVPSVVASTVIQDLLVAETNARNVAVACLVAKWWTDQLVEGAVNVRANGQTLAFERFTDRTYTPAPGATATLVCSNSGNFVVQARLGATCSFGTSGMVTRVQDSSGNYVQANYHNANNDYLLSVSNSFGNQLTFNWTSNRVSSVADSAGRTAYYYYSPLGCLTGVTDVAGYKWGYAYDSDNNLLTETDPSGVVTVRNAYNQFGQVTNQLAANGQPTAFAFADGVSAWQVDSLGGKTRYAFDNDGRLLVRVTPDNGTNASFYDVQGQLTSNFDAVGRATIHAYDASNNLRSVVEVANTPNTRTNFFGYDGQFHLVAVTNALGRVMRMSYDNCHRPTFRLTPDGTTMTNAYDAHGLPVSTIVRDANGYQLKASSIGYNFAGLATNVTATDSGTTLFFYDKTGNPTNIIDALGHSTRLFYDPRGLLTNKMDAAGNRTICSYTPAGRLAFTVNPLNQTNVMAWTASGQPAATYFPNGALVTNEYDVADRLVAATDPRGNRVQLALDIMGNATNRWTANWSESTWFNPVGVATTSVNAISGRSDVAYDSLNRATNVTDTLRRNWLSSFNPLGVVTTTTDPRNRVTSYGLDVMGRRTSVAYPSGRTEGFGFDGLGRQTTFINAASHVYGMFYDAQNRLVAATNAAGEQVVRNFFDACGNLTNKLDGASRPIRYQFDVLNRCTNTVYSDGTTEAFTFDAIGNLLTAKNAVTTNSFAYDVMNRLAASTSRVAGVSFVATYCRDPGGLVTNLTVNGTNTIRYAFDADGRVTNVTDWAGHAWRISRDTAGRATAFTYPNGINETVGYDASSAVTNWQYSSGSTPITGRAITRDVMGLKTKEKITAGPLPVPCTNRRVANTYNAADRLTSAKMTGTNKFTTAYNCDPCGALTNVVQSGASVPLAVYSYDLAGRMISANATNLALSASYDAFGNRVQTTVNGTNHLWIIDHADPLKRPLMETDTNGTPVRFYIWGAGRLLAIVEASGTFRYVLSDDQGNVVALTDVGGNVTDSFNYGPYGEDWGRTGTNSIPFRWLGCHGVWRVADNATLYLTHHRAFDTTLKRFLSADPLGLGGGPNVYSYALGNPLAYIDPLGLACDTGNSFSAGENIGANSVGSANGYVSAYDHSMETSLTADPYMHFDSDPRAEGPSGLAAWTPVLGNYMRADADMQNGAYGSAAFCLGLVFLDAATLGGDALFVDAGETVVERIGASAAESTAVRWGPANGSGPLGETVANTFRSGSYTESAVSQETTLYRSYGGSAGELASYWTRTPPAGPLQSTMDSALNPAWGNTAQSVSTIRVPSGTTIYEGFAAPQGGLLGGGSQVYIPKVNPNWLVH